ncbi:hypothetical protein Aph01nite_14110 [Acrocarpospora phusangensis]|uniref:Uncharacterized protein n=1 Tax=Acrocarpospora phusangensis TaxID=1070424 RepID=A0A919UIV0_9ACTN|nr:hypothetical protein [Acrocarpospora phusangensis]GIH23101.1 hypothetical protein Aph01nite_14110 [Acrocarpospora phusangensis]
MRTGNPDAGTILVLDLRGAEEAKVEGLVAARVERFRAQGAGRASALVIDDTVRLPERQAVYARISGSTWFDQMMCLAVGPSPTGDRRHALDSVAPASASLAILWAGDPSGVGWRMDGIGGAEAFRQDGLDLNGLIDVLCVPEVYARVQELARRVPDGVASPGLLTVTGDVGGELLTETRLQVIAQLTDVALPTTRPEALSVYTAEAGARIRPELVLRSTGQIRTLSDLAATQVAAADTALRQLAGFRRRGLAVRTLHGRLAELRQTLATLRATLRSAFDALHGTRLARPDLGLLERLGVEAGSAQAERAQVSRQLEAAVTEALERRQSLPAIAEQLREFADRAVPVGSATFLPRVEAVCPDRVLDELARPAAFPLRPLWPAMLTAGLLVPLLTAFPFGPVAGGAAAAVWLLAVWLLRARVPVPRGRTGLARAAGPWLLAHLAASAAGAAAGVFLAAGLPALLWYVPAGLAALLLTVIPALWWAKAARDWARRVETGAAERAAAALLALAAQVAYDEWAMREARRYASDAARTVSWVLDQCAARLTEHAAGLRPLRGRSGGARGVQGHGGGLADVVTGDLVDAVEKALEPAWSRLGDGTFQGLGDSVSHGLAEILRDYDDHLRRTGVHQPPAFARSGSPAREVLIHNVWGTPEHVRSAVNAPAGGLMLQFCADADLHFLQVSAELAQVVRFAPRAVQGLGHGVGDLVWTRSPHAAGTLRLVPLRPGVVRLITPVDRETQR